MSIYLQIVATLSGISPPSDLPTTTASSSTVSTVLQIVFAIAGALSLLMITISGLRFITAAGNADKTHRAREGVIFSLVGLAIAVTAEAIVTFVVNRL